MEQKCVICAKAITECLARDDPYYPHNTEVLTQREYYILEQEHRMICGDDEDGECIGHSTRE